MEKRIPSGSSVTSFITTPELSQEVWGTPQPATHYSFDSDYIQVANYPHCLNIITSIVFFFSSSNDIWLDVSHLTLGSKFSLLFQLKRI